MTRYTITVEDDADLSTVGPYVGNDDDTAGPAAARELPFGGAFLPLLLQLGQLGLELLKSLLARPK